MTRGDRKQLGFNFTKVPNLVIRNVLPTIKPIEWMVYSLLMQETYGYQTDCISITLEEIVSRCSASRRAVIDAISAIEEMGLIHVDKRGKGNPENTYTMRIPELECNKNSGDEECRSCTLESAGAAPSGQSTRLSYIKEREKESNTPLPPSSKKNQDETVEESSDCRELDKPATPYPQTPAPLRPDPDESVPVYDVSCLDLEDDIATFATNAYRRVNRRAKIQKLTTRAGRVLIERLEEREREYGPEEFRLAILTYLEDQDDYLLQSRWPINLFLARTMDYTSNIPECARAEAETWAPGDSPPSGVATPHPDYKIPVRRPAEHLLDLWNQRVPEANCTMVISRQGFARQNVLKDPDFDAAFDDLCEKAKAIHTAKNDVGWLTFQWLLSNKEGTANWRRLLDGELDWMAKSTKRNTVADATQEAIRLVREGLA
jgi:hypothetical protein